MTSTDTRFLLKRFARLLALADDLATESSGSPEDQAKFEALKREIEVLNARLQNIHKL